MTEPRPEPDEIDAPATDDGAPGEATDPAVGADAADPADTGDDAFDALRRERDEYLDKLQRLKAEYDNYRRREERERARWANEAIERIVLELLPIVDNFARAAAADQGAEAHDEYVAGIRLVEKQLGDVLEKIGVEPIESAGRPFDPEVHEALQMVDTNEVAPNHVVSEFQRGYRMLGNVVRAARVIVARAPSESESADGEPESDEEA